MQHVTFVLFGRGVMDTLRVNEDNSGVKKVGNSTSSSYSAVFFFFFFYAGGATAVSAVEIPVIHLVSVSNFPNGDTSPGIHSWS